jgi:hypothetical protein
VLVVVEIDGEGNLDVWGIDLGFQVWFAVVAAEIEAKDVPNTKGDGPQSEAPLVAVGEVLAVVELGIEVQSEEVVAGGVVEEVAKAHVLDHDTVGKSVSHVKPMGTHYLNPKESHQVGLIPRSHVALAVYLICTDDGDCDGDFVVSSLLDGNVASMASHRHAHHHDAFSGDAVFSEVSLLRIGLCKSLRGW